MGWFRYFFVVSVIIGALLVSYGFKEISSQQVRQDKLISQVHSLVLKNEKLATAVAASNKRELSNRTSNVSVWCGAINENRAESIRLSAVHHRHGTEAYKLKLLSCPTLEHNTLNSGIVKEVLTLP